MQQGGDAHVPLMAVLMMYMPSGQYVVIIELLAEEYRPSGKPMLTVQFEKGGPSFPTSGG